MSSTDTASILPGEPYPIEFPNSSYPSALTNVNGTLYFVADDGVSGMELWKTDGTAAGTVLIKDINPGITEFPVPILEESEQSEERDSLIAPWPESFPNSSYPNSLININGTVFFTADDGVNGAELWKTDGTEAGTMLVKDIKPGSTDSFPNSSYPNNLTDIDGTLYFTVAASEGSELWKSDGTETGTVLVKKIDSNPNTYINGLTKANDGIYFANTESFPFLYAADGLPVPTPLPAFSPSAPMVFPGPANTQSPEGVMEGQSVDGVYMLTSTNDNNIPLEARGQEVWGLSGNDVLQGTPGKDKIRGGKDRDAIAGGNGDDALYGDKDSDVISGSDGNDTMNGGKNNDAIDGGNGDDILSGDKGQDVLTGGPGNDTFILSLDVAPNQVDRADIITDFVMGDKISLVPKINFNDLQLETVTINFNGLPALDSTAIKSGNNYLGVVYGVDRTLLTPNVFA